MYRKSRGDFLPGQGIVFPEEPEVGCQCTDCYSGKEQCCPQLANTTFMYNRHGTLVVNRGGAIWECNSRCKCSNDCPNRVVQKGRQGEDSWWHFNRHKALVAAGKPSAPRPHRPAFSRDIAKELVPLYNRLSDKTLLARCCRMRTQNANESYNALVWKRCPKTEFASLCTVETATAMAVIEFDLGPQGFERVLEKMDMKPGSHHLEHTRKATELKITQAKAKALDTSKTAHKRRKLEAVAAEQKRVEEVPLTIFRTTNKRGWGVRTERRIKKGTFLFEYFGEVITNEEAEQRGRTYDAQGITYLFDLDYDDSDDNFYTVDAGKCGNVSHFVNHSCDSNMNVYSVWINNLNRQMPRLAFFASKDICCQEELTFDYKMSCCLGPLLVYTVPHSVMHHSYIMGMK
ncbi:hypothetical protein HPB47_014022 [Ixodes persulcatus]|uniref:Uncharacterized protein n=1 Tax=Ixodes persulcatus TaxID=34615 RepID=A0AC60QYD7_IXOPE|nr:hypothetical protein HPB47_014022 [Ixodes persulcatus]